MLPSISRGARDCAINDPSGRLAEAGPPQDAPEPAAQLACDDAEVHIKEGGKVRPIESHAAEMHVASHHLQQIVIRHDRGL